MYNRQKIGIVLGVIVFVLIMILPEPDGMNPKAMKAAGVSILMAILWVTEAISIFATALFL